MFVHQYPTQSLVHVEPGEEIKTCIRYDHETGSITVSIAIMKETKKGNSRDSATKVEDSDRRSEIVVDRPFLHTSHFESWKDFFEKCISAECEVKTKLEEERNAQDEGVVTTQNKLECGCLARPYLNIEYKGRVSVETLHRYIVYPLEVKEASFPGFTSDDWRKYLFCPRTGDSDALDGLEENASLHIDDAITILSK